MCLAVRKILLSNSVLTNDGSSKALKSLNDHAKFVRGRLRVPDTDLPQLLLEKITQARAATASSPAADVQVKEEQVAPAVAAGTVSAVNEDGQAIAPKKRVKRSR